ncbi:hypothetical protein TPHA_0H00310 [Tetrapisispora phaffii CBS 4417]|uniref:Uncharacterized protein n=1 Tax=Tetrapisispora phaffii (strain ATCC 24235 / CBS 4417 / NBRC 1672 / NRRL Y-8282 / UCD 70-5) TaxID=1071381 RepID=G8BWT7_TETPH|nr:hypothetical protein TPHA_0H00310 [Tetrapisispora phaffii CBS 4417]CCE64241.1 hypothetical protein TPHA_0H00310 [Tetrapisispora phaffii CBS 4417]
MRTTQILKRITLGLVLLSFVNLTTKLLVSKVFPAFLLWMTSCPNNECTELHWWQKSPTLERIVWKLIDNI